MRKGEVNKGETFQLAWGSDEKHFAEVNTEMDK